MMMRERSITLDDGRHIALLIIVQQGDVAPVIEGDGPLPHPHQR